MSRDYDLIVVGAGLTGLSLCYWAQKKLGRQKLRVLLLDRREQGFGASGRNAGFMTSGSVTFFQTLIDRYGLGMACDIWQFSEENIRLVAEEIIQPHSDFAHYQQTGAYSLALSSPPHQHQWEQLQASAEVMRREGFTCKTLSAQLTRERLGMPQCAGSIFLPGEGQVHPIRLLHLIWQKAQALSPSPGLLQFAPFTEVMSVEKGDEGRNYVHTNKGSFKATHVILAQNAYLPLTSPFFQGQIKSARGQILLTEPTAPFLQGPCYIAPHKVYLRQLPSGHVLIGGLRHLEEDSSTTAYSTQVTPLIQHSLEKYLQESFPPCASLNVIHRWAGLMGFTEKEWPLLGEMEGLPGVHYLGGFSGHGMGYCFLLASQLIDLIYQGKRPFAGPQ